MPAKRYDWDQWFEKTSFSLKYGEDYHCTQSTMYQQILGAAHKKGVRVKIVDRGNWFDILVVNPLGKVLCQEPT